MSTTEPSAPAPTAEAASLPASDSPAVTDGAVPRWVLPVVLLLSLGPSLAALPLRLAGIDGVWSASVEFLRPSAHGVVEWTAALTALLAGLLAYVRWRGAADDALETVTLAFALPAVAVLDAMHALAPWTVAEARFDLLLALTWNASRWFLALALAVGLAMAWSASRTLAKRSARPGARALPLVLAGIGCVLFVAGSWLAEGLRTDSELLPALRPWELGPLVLFLLAGCLWAGDVARFRGTLSTRCLQLAFVPLVLCQLEMFVGSLVLGHWQKLLAYAVLAGGALGEYAETMRSQQNAWRSRHDVELELRSKRDELERLDHQRRAQEEKRREAEHSLRMLAKAVETMSLGVTITDMEGRILYVNPADARIHGYRVDELIGQDSRIYSAGDTVETADDAMEPWARERMNRTRAGEVFPVRLVSDRVRDADGQPIATVTICEDIRERIRIREALERRDRILEAVAFAAERFLSQSEWETSVGDVLERLGEATGVDRVYLDLINEAYPFGIEDFTYYWSALGDIDARLSDSYDTGNRVELVDRWESHLRDGDVLSGRVVDLPIEEQPIFSRRGVRSFALVPFFVQARWQGFLCLEATTADREWSHVELEALKAAARTFGASIQWRRDEEALAASEAKYRQLLEGAHDLVQSVAPDGRFQFVNRSWKETLGYDDEEVARLTVWDVVRPAYPDSRRDVLQSMLNDDGLGRVEAIFVGHDGAEIAVEGQVTTRFEDGLPVAAQGIFRDITERRQLDKMKQEFISTVSHELRTPLTSIIASLGLLASGRLASQPERYEELISVAHRNSTRLLGLINNLLDLQKLAARKMSFRSDPVDVRGLLDEAARGIRAFAEQARVHLVVEPIPAGLELLGDRDRLMQVLNNLVSNAIKFSPAGEEVVLGGYSRRSRVVLKVADRGPGIPEEFRSRLFDQFTQADPSKTRSSGGSGLGLSIAKGLVEGMRGHIDLDTRIDEGTTFYVDLPAASR